VELPCSARFCALPCFLNFKVYKHLISLDVMVRHLGFLFEMSSIFCCLGTSLKSAHISRMKGPDTRHEMHLYKIKKYRYFPFLSSFQVCEQKYNTIKSSLILASKFKYFGHFGYIAVNIRSQLLELVDNAICRTNRYQRIGLVETNYINYWIVNLKVDIV